MNQTRYESTPCMNDQLIERLLPLRDVTKENIHAPSEMLKQRNCHKQFVIQKLCLISYSLLNPTELFL